jgi:hypothetical protein
MGISGFTGYQVIQSLKRAYPHLSDSLVKLQVAGYTGRQIAGMMRKAKGQKVSDEDFFESSTTEHEKTKEFDKRNKRQAVNQALSLLGATGAIAGISLGAYQYLKANANNPNMTVLPALGKNGRRTAPQQIPSKSINVKNKQLPNQQKQLPFIPGMGQPGQQGQVPQLSGPQAPQGPPPQAQLPGRPPTLGLPEPGYTKSVGIVKNLGNNTIFDNIVKQGLDPITTSAIIRSIMKDTDKRSLGILEKAPGGLDKVVSDYTQYFQQKKQQEQYSAAVPKEPYDDRVEFINPSRIIKMKGPQAQQQGPEPGSARGIQLARQEQEMQQQAQVGPGRQRLQGLMEKLRAARGENTIKPVEAAPAPMPQAPIAPQEQPLSTVPSYPVLPPAPKNLPAPKAKEKAVEKPKAKRATKAEKEKKSDKEEKAEKKENVYSQFTDKEVEEAYESLFKRVNDLKKEGKENTKEFEILNKNKENALNDLKRRLAEKKESEEKLKKDNAKLNRSEYNKKEKLTLHVNNLYSSLLDIEKELKINKRRQKTQTVINRINVLERKRKDGLERLNALNKSENLDQEDWKKFMDKFNDITRNF